MIDIPTPVLGQLVKVIQGRDEGSYAVIIGIEEPRFVIIADGDKRKFDQPKRKNILHVELQQAISHEVVDSLKESGRVTNSKLRYVIQNYTKQLSAANVEDKGD